VLSNSRTWKVLLAEPARVPSAENTMTSSRYTPGSSPLNAIPVPTCPAFRYQSTSTSPVSGGTEASALSEPPAGSSSGTPLRVTGMGSSMTGVISTCSPPVPLLMQGK